MKKKRIDELEQNISGIDEKHHRIIESFERWKKAIDEGDEGLAFFIREKASAYLGKDSKLRHFPPNDADVAGMVDLHEWHKFIKYNFK